MSAVAGHMPGRRAGWVPGATLPVLLVVGSGVALGVVTQVLQGVLPHGWGVLANSGVMWALVAFALGAALPTARWAAVGGAAQLVLASVTYYAAVERFEGHGSDVRSTLIWSAAGVVAGSVFGLAGHAALSRPVWRPAALALVAGTLTGEGIHLVGFAGNPDLRGAGIAELVLAVVLAGASLARSGRRRPALGPTRRARATGGLAAAAVLVAAAILTLAAGAVIDAAFLAG